MKELVNSLEMDYKRQLIIIKCEGCMIWLEIGILKGNEKVSCHSNPSQAS